MNLIYLESRTGTLCLVHDRIIGVTENRTPTDYPTRILIDSAPWNFDVRNSMDDVQAKLMAAES